MRMPLPYEVRVINEKIDLDEKLAKLVAFIDNENGETFKLLSCEVRELLLEQRVIMHSYSRVLAARINLFGTTAAAGSGISCSHKRIDSDEICLDCGHSLRQYFKEKRSRNV